MILTLLLAVTRQNLLNLMPDILFIGNFLSKKRGTKGIVERIAARQAEFKQDFFLASHYENRVIRFVDIICNILFRRYNIVIIDVYSGLYFFMLIGAVTLARFRNKKIVLNFRGGKLYLVHEKFPKLFQYMVKQSWANITPSLFLKDILVKHNYQVDYLPNFLDIIKFPYSRNIQANNLLWIRAFASIYNPQMAIYVLDLVRRHVPDATLTMVGPDHGELSSCVTLIDSLNLTGAITITGKIDNDQLPPFYHTHRVFLNTTTYESFGLAVLEAASCGIPVVSNSVGEIPYLWKDGEEMFLCKAGDNAEMAEKVIQLLQNPRMATTLSMSARAKAEKFSWEAVKPQWQKLMQGHE